MQAKTGNGKGGEDEIVKKWGLIYKISYDNLTIILR